MKTPGGQHHTGGLYVVNVHLALPEGREVNIEHTAQNDERYADLNFALNDAFKRTCQQEDGREIYFYRNNVLHDEFAKLDIGSSAAFAEEIGGKRPQASTVKLMAKHSLRV